MSAVAHPRRRTYGWKSAPRAVCRPIMGGESGAGIALGATGFGSAGGSPESVLPVGDVIHSVSSVTVRSLDALRVLVEDARADTELVLQVRRNGHLLFVTCQIY